MDCVFCRIVAGTLPSYRVLEDEHHLAFLSIFPNTPGFTVVIPKTHLSSDVLALDEKEYLDLLMFTRRVDKVLRQGLNVDRCALIIEGLMIPHAHAKLIPLHGLDGRTTVLSEGTSFTERYAGYVTSMEGPPMSGQDLAAVLATIHAGQS